MGIGSSDFLLFWLIHLLNRCTAYLKNRSTAIFWGIDYPVHLKLMMFAIFHVHLLSYHPLSKSVALRCLAFPGSRPFYVLLIFVVRFWSRGCGPLPYSYHFVWIKILLRCFVSRTLACIIFPWHVILLEVPGMGQLSALISQPAVL